MREAGDAASLLQLAEQVTLIDSVAEAHYFSSTSFART
jgi:hypothetical protein